MNRTGNDYLMCQHLTVLLENFNGSLVHIKTNTDRNETIESNSYYSADYISLAYSYVAYTIANNCLVELPCMIYQAQLLAKL